MGEQSDGREAPKAPERQNLFQELTRRRVVKVALVYFAVAWSVTEVISFLLDAIPIFPSWSSTIVALLFVLGFPVTMFLAWRFDVGPEGIQRTAAMSSRDRLTIASALLLLVLSTGGLFYLIYPQIRDPEIPRAAPFEPAENSIAVMPFANIGDDPENEFFSEGVPDTILHNLANLEDLVVIARTSSFALGDTNADATTIGRELNVRYLLEGSVQRLGQELRIITRLIDTPDGKNVWSLDRRLLIADIFALQDEVALEITSALNLTLRAEERERLVAHGTDSVPAYLAFLRGNYAQQSRSLDRLREALRYYEEAIDLDPSYARAYVGIAKIYDHMRGYGAIGRSEGIALSRRFAEVALRHDEELGEAYALLAVLESDMRELQPDGNLIEKAVSLSPNDPYVMRTYAQALCTGRYEVHCHEEKLEIQLEAVRRSPEDPNLYFDIAWTMVSLGRLDEVAAYFSEAVRRNPDMTTGYTRLGRWYAGYGNDWPRAVVCLREAIARDPGNVFPKGELASIYIDVGLDGMAEELLEEAIDPHTAWDDFLPYVRLKLHVYRNEMDEAADIIREFYEEIAWGAQAVISNDLAIGLAFEEAEFGRIIEHLEGTIARGGKLDNYESVRIESNEALGAAASLIHVLELIGQVDRADALGASAKSFLEREAAAGILWRPGISHALAQLALRDGDLDKAVEALATRQGAYFRDAWYVSRALEFRELHGHQRFDSLVQELGSESARIGKALVALGDDLPRCVSNPREIFP